MRIAWIPTPHARIPAAKVERGFPKPKSVSCHPGLIVTGGG